MKKKKTIAERIESFAKKVMDEYPEERRLVVAQQINYASVLLRAMGSKIEEEYKKSLYDKS